MPIPPQQLRHKEIVTPPGELFLEFVGKIPLPGKVEQQIGVKRQ